MSREESLIALLVAPELRPAPVNPRLKNKTAVYCGRVVKSKDSDVNAIVCVPTRSRPQHSIQDQASADKKDVVVINSVV